MISFNSNIMHARLYCDMHSYREGNSENFSYIFIFKNQKAHIHTHPCYLTSKKKRKIGYKDYINVKY